MILVDTSVWISFFRGRSEARDLSILLDSREVCTHPWIIGELALGHLGRRRAMILEDLRLLPIIETVRGSEVMHLIEARGLAGSGLGWVDVHLLAAALVSASLLWSLDRNLAQAAGRMKAGYQT